MGVDIKIVEEPKQPLTMNPKKFGMWLFMVTVFMVFAALSSAYIVRQAEGNWAFFELPTLFWVNTVVILISSLTLHWAYVSAKRDNLESVKIAMVITTILGFAFMIGQFLAWKELVSNRIHLVGNPSGSFVYIISGLHAAHVIGGIVYLLIILNVGQIEIMKMSVLRYILKPLSILLVVPAVFMALSSRHTLKVSSRDLNPIEMCATYWHFLGGLWLYLFLFLLLYR
jgi:cytochrome c oxidase subunit 3